MNQQKYNPEKFATYFSKFNLRSTTSSIYRYNCPLCGGRSDTGYLNFGTQKVYCHRDESHNMSMVQMMRTLEGGGWYSTYKNLSETAINTFVESRKKLSLENVPTKELPFGFKTLDETFYREYPKVVEYLESRYFDLEVLKSLSWGYCDRNISFDQSKKLDKDYVKQYWQNAWKGYVIIPCFVNDQLVYYTGRSYETNVAKGFRHKHPVKESPDEVGKSDIIYNQDVLNIYEVINVFEGIADVVTVGEGSVSTLGVKISQAQIKILAECSVKRLVFCDDLGEFEKTIRKVYNYYGYCDENGISPKEVQLIDLRQLEIVHPKWSVGSDVNDLARYVYSSRQKAVEVYHQLVGATRIYYTFNEFRRDFNFI